MKRKEHVINDLVGFKNLKIVQNTNYFNFSLDSVLLPNFVMLNKKIKRIIDLGTGNAPIPLILSTKTDAEIIGIEIQKEVYDLAVQSVSLNNLDDRISLINDDFNNLINHFETDSIDLITSNPPYFKYNERSNINENHIKTVARHEVYMKFEDICLLSKKFLKNGASLVLVHRTDRLTEIIEVLKKHNLEPKRIRFIYPKVNSESNLVLIDSQKNAKVGLKVLSPLIVHNDNGSYSDEVLKMFS